MQIFNCDQGSADWFTCRLGIPTASRFHAVLASGKGGKESETRRKYLYDLAGEILTGEPTEGFTNGYLERGHAVEEEARDWYKFNTDHDVEQVGFCRDDLLGAGASPDGLVGSDGAVEFKTRMARLQLELLEADRMPPEHVAQCQGVLWITGRRWVDFVSYSRKIKPFKVRVERDDAYIATLKSAVDAFNAELRILVRKFQP